MKTILYDNSIGKIISPIFENGYQTDGKSQPVSPPFYELKYKPTPMPSHDTETETVSAVWVPDTVLKTYTQVWTVRTLTDEERIADKEIQAQAKESEIDPIQIKKLLRITTAETDANARYIYVT